MPTQNATNMMSSPAHSSSHPADHSGPLTRREQPLDRKRLMEQLWAAIDGKK